MLLNQLAAEGYSYNVVYHARDIIKAALAEALDQDVLERSVARKAVIPEIEEREKLVMPVEWYAKLLAGLETARDRAIFLIACFCGQRTVWPDLGLVSAERVRDRQHGMARPTAAQEDQAQKPFRPDQLSPRCHSRGSGFGHRTVAGPMSGRSFRWVDISRNPGPRTGHAGNPDVSRQLAAPASELFHPRQEGGIPPKCKHNWDTATSEQRCIYIQTVGPGVIQMVK
jgi:hypothetical protein